MDHYLEVLALPMIAGWLEVGSLGVVQIWNFSQPLVIYFSTKNGNGPSFANSFLFLQFLPKKYENHWPNVTVDQWTLSYPGSAESDFAQFFAFAGRVVKRHKKNKQISPYPRDVRVEGRHFIYRVPLLMGVTKKEATTNCEANRG